MGYHWLDGINEVIEKVQVINNPQKCQQLCSEEERCNWFTWKDQDDPTGCWLHSNKGTTKSFDRGRNEGATGPKYCTGK